MRLSDVENLDVRTNALVLTASVLALGLLLDVPFVTLMLGFLVIAVQTWFGYEVYRRCIWPTASNSFELLGMGFALGSLGTVVIDQIFVRTMFRDYWWWLLIPIALLLSIKNRSLSSPGSRTTQFNDFMEWFILVIGLCLLLLVQERYWPLWLGTSALFLAFVLRRRTRPDSKLNGHPLIVLIMTLGVVIVAWLTINWRPKHWWIKTADLQFFEALSFSLSHFGAGDQVFAAGIPIKYHWLSYAWTGMLDRIIAADEWVVISRLAPVVVVVTLVPLAIAFALHLGLRERWLVVALALFVLLNDFNFESFSMVFSYIWILATGVMAWHCLRSLKIAQVALLIAFAAAAFGAKSSNLVVIAGLVGTVALYRADEWRSSYRTRVALLVGSFVAVVVTYILFYSGSGYSQLVEIGVSGFAQDAFGDIRTLGIRPRVLAATLVLLNALLIFIFTMCAFLLRRHFKFVGLLQKLTHDPLLLLLALTLLPTVAVLTFFVAPIHEQEEYFLHSFTIMGMFLVVAALKGLAALLSFSRNQAAVIIAVSGLIALALSALTPTNEGTTFAIFVRIVLGSPVALVSAGIGMLMLVLKPVTNRGRLAVVTWLLTGSLTAAAISHNEPWITGADTFKREILSESHVSRYLGNEDVIEAAELVKRFTNINDVIASNYFCEASWCPTNEYSPTRENWLLGGEAMTLVVYSQRRYLVSGYGFTWQNIEPPQSIRRRIAWSLQPQPFNLESLDDVAPKYFLRDLTMPCPCGELVDQPIVERTSRFELYDLSAVLNPPG